MDADEKYMSSWASGRKPGYEKMLTVFLAGPLQHDTAFCKLISGNNPRRSMDWYLHRQAIGRAGPALMMVSIMWLIAGYFYFDPFVRLGFVPAPKASWGETAHWLYIETAVRGGISAGVGVLIGYVILYARLRRGARFGPVSWWIYVLAVSVFPLGLMIGLAVLHYLLPFWIPGFDLFAELAAS